MFYIIFIFYWAPLTSSFSYTLDGVIQLGPNWEYKFNIGSPENGDQISGKTGFQRSVTSESDDSSSTEDEVEMRQRAMEEFIRTTSTTTTKKSSNLYKTLNKYDKRQAIDHQASSSPLIPDDNSDKEKRTTKTKIKYHRADSDSGDVILSSDEENNSFPKDPKDTQPYREYEIKNNENIVTEKNNQHKTSSDSESESEEKKNIKQIHESKGKDYKKNKKIVKVEDSEIDVNENSHDTSFVNKQTGKPIQRGPLLLSWFNRMYRKIKKTNANKNNKTRNLIELRIDISQEKKDFNKLLRNINFNDFYSTPAVLVPNNQKTTAKMPKLLRNKNNENNYIKIGLNNLFVDHKSQRIKDNYTINSFTKQILENTLKLFDEMKNRTTEYRWKKKMKHLARSYVEKFNEFLRATKHHTIKTRFGTRKVILNAIDVSKHIVSRLVNLMADDMEKRKLSYSNSTVVMFRAEIEKEEMHELKRACEDLDICKVQKGFTEFITDMLLKMLSLQNDKFKTAFDLMIESARKTDFALSETVGEGIRKRIDYCGRQNVNVQKGMVMIVKNMIIYRNTPLVLYNDSNPSESKLQSTLSFLEIINTLDEKVLNDESNVQEWESISREMDEWVQGRNGNIQNIMTRFISHLSSVIKEIDSTSWNTILRNAEILFL